MLCLIPRSSICYLGKYCAYTVDGDPGVSALRPVDDVDVMMLCLEALCVHFTDRAK